MADPVEGPLPNYLAVGTDELVLLLALAVEREGYAKTVQLFADRFGREKRTVELWVRRGRDMLELLRVAGYFRR